MITNTKNVQTFKQVQDALSAVRWTNLDYTNSAITRERARRVAEARKALGAVVPPKTERKGAGTRAAG